MKRRSVKKMVAAGLLASLFAANGSMTALAASSVSGYVGGASVSGSVSKNTTSATAKTTCTRAASVQATAYVYYQNGNQKYYSLDSTSTSGGTTVVTVSRKVSGASVVGGKGDHVVYFDSYSWNDMTTTGIILVNATRI